MSGHENECESETKRDKNVKYKQKTEPNKSKMKKKNPFCFVVFQNGQWTKVNENVECWTNLLFMHERRLTRSYFFFGGGFINEICEQIGYIFMGI